MPTRYFCDLCDGKIHAAKPYFLLEIRITNNDSYSYNDPTFDAGPNRRREPIAQAHNMVCEECARKMAFTINAIQNPPVLQHTPEPLPFNPDDNTADYREPIDIQKGEDG